MNNIIYGQCWVCDAYLKAIEPSTPHCADEIPNWQYIPRPVSLEIKCQSIIAICPDCQKAPNCAGMLENSQI